ncbi:MAG TPA: AAA domain-containing protein [Myxococcaceae bacterium]|nr:AAA domain-containing protein [Myxococcaceae bacterium]
MPRDPSFFDGLLRLLSLERAAAKARFEEERARLTLQELENKGLVALDLESVEESIGLGGRILVTFEHPERRDLRARFHPGDEVHVRPRKAEDVAPARGIVSRGTRRQVQIAFDRPPPEFVSEGRLRLDLAPNDVTFDRAEAAVRRVQALERGQERRTRELLLGNEPPKFDRLRPATLDQPLNPEQQQAVEQALAAEDFFLVHGPPGTGKSTVLAEVASQAARAGKRLLCTAASNAAVDHLLELCLDRGLSAVRIGHPARVAPALVQHALDVMVEAQEDRKLSRELFEEAFALQGYARRQRTQGRSRERFSNARESAAEARKLMDEARKLERKAVRGVLERAQAVCVTLSSIDSPVLGGESFDLALFDEATQAIEPLGLLAFLRAKTVVLAGDHRQLPPTVLSMEASKQGLSTSLFERLLADHGDAVKRMLREQYRMHEQIMTFPSREMYGGELRAHPSVAKRTLAEVLKPGAAVDAPPLLFLDTAGKGFDDEVAQGSESRFNPGEAALVAARAKELLGAGLPPAELAVIAPYSAQADLLRERSPHPDVEVDTVDAFQGREKDAILVSLTRSSAGGDIGFLADLRRMNVAITRARRHLFVVGDSATLAGHPFYARFIEEAQKQGGYRSAWEWPEPEPAG